MATGRDDDVDPDETSSTDDTSPADDTTVDDDDLFLLDTPGDGEDGSGDGAPPSPRRSWLAAGAVLLVIGLVVAAVAVFSLGSDDDDGTRSSATARSTTTTSASSSPAAGGPTTTSVAKPARWPGSIDARPTAFGVDGDPPPAEPGDLEPGFYLWQDFAGWHLWMVSGQGSDASVEIRADDDFATAKPTGGEPVFQQEGNKLVLARGGADENVVGVDFNPGFYARTMVVTTAGELPMHLGAQATPAGPYVGLQFSTAN